MNVRLVFISLLILFILGFDPQLVYDRVMESYAIVATSLHNARQLRTLKQQLQRAPTIDLIAKVIFKEHRGSGNSIHQLMRLITLIISLFLPIDIDRTTGYLYVVGLLLVLHSFTRGDPHVLDQPPQPPPLPRQAERLSRIRPARESNIPALLQQLESMDPAWQQRMDPFMSSLLQELKGPLTHDILSFPVATPMGHLYERQILEKWFQTHGRIVDPKTNEPIDRDAIIQNIPVVVNIIEKILTRAVRILRKKQQQRMQTVQFQESQVPARDHPMFGSYIRNKDRPGFDQAMRRSNLTTAQKQQLTRGFIHPQRKVRVRQPSSSSS